MTHINNMNKINTDNLERNKLMKKSSKNVVISFVISHCVVILYYNKTANIST